MPDPIPIEVDGRHYEVRFPRGVGEPRYRIVDQDGFGVETMWDDAGPWLEQLEAQRNKLEHTMSRIRAAEMAIRERIRDARDGDGA